jgi:hypothetical protein
MPLNTIPLPFGLREVKVTPYTDLAATTLGTSVKLPNSRTLSFSEVENFEDLRGDDKLVATHGSGAQVEWSLEGGGVSLEAVWAMYGGGAGPVTTGVTPNQVKTLSKKSTDQRPYFKAEGRAISDSGGDFHIVLWKCKATDKLEGEMADGSFMLTGASGVGLPSTMVGNVDTVWEFVQNEAPAGVPIA